MKTRLDAKNSMPNTKKPSQNPANKSLVTGIKRPLIRGVPTNIITGFLGVGKTSFIKHLLSQKPEGERWAILVNEFGEVGLDGALLGGEIGRQKSDEIFIREVPGGCMCCASGLPMQIALNQLLAKAQPSRLLIEPTGLGHPREVLNTLQAEHYRSVLDLRATITLVDARNVLEPRYRLHATFQEQIGIADHIIAAKSDAYTNNEQHQLEDYIASLETLSPPVTPYHQGQQIPLALLDAKSSKTQLSLQQARILTGRSEAQTSRFEQEGQQSAAANNIQQQLNEQEWAFIENQGEGYFSLGWIFSPEHVFDFEQIKELIGRIEAERLKAVFITHQGIFAFNRYKREQQVVEMDESDDSRLEIISIDQAEGQAIKALIEESLLSPLS